MERGERLQPDVFDHIEAKLIHQALKAWDAPQRLGRLPLAALRIVEARRRSEQYLDTPAGRGTALQDVLRTAIDEIKPEAGEPKPGAKQWRPFIIVSDRYVARQDAGAVRARLGLGQSGYFQEQRRAFGLLAEILSRWEVQKRRSDEPASRRQLHTLRAPVADFTGRAYEIATLESRLTSEDRTVSLISGVRGLGGVGKTELALVMGRRLCTHYPDAQLMVELQPGGRALSSEALLAAIIRAFSPDVPLPKQLLELQALYRHTLHDRRGLLLLDNAVDETQVQLLLPPPAGWAALITSRTRLQLPGGALLLDLAVLPRAEAVALLRYRLVDGGRGDIAEEADARLDRLAGLCGDLPLALRIAAAFLAISTERSLDDYLEALEADRLGALQADGDAIDRVLAISVHQLEEEAPELARRWDALPVFAAPFDLDAGAAVWDLPIAQARYSLRHLHQRSLVQYDPASGRYGLHDLLRAYAARRLRDYELFALRHARHYVQVARRGEEFYLQGGEQVDAGLALFDRERAQIDAAWNWLLAHTGDASQEIDELLVDYAEATVNTGDLRYDVRCERIPQLAAATEAAIRLGHREAEHQIVGNLGTAHAALGEFARAIACHERRLALAAARGDEGSVCIALNQLGNAYADLGDLRRAIDYYQQSLSIARERKDLRGEARALGNLGLMYKSLGDVERAVDCQQQALHISHDLGDRRGEGIDLGNLGNAYRALGDLQRARECHEQALQISCALADRRSEVHDLCNLGNVYDDLGEIDRSVAYYERALALARELSMRRTEGIVLHNLAESFAELGDTECAIARWEQALAIRREIGDRQGEANTSWYVGELLIKHGECERALALMQGCVDYLREVHHPKAEVRAARLEQVRRG